MVSNLTREDLYVDISDGGWECDGCGSKIPEGKKYLSGIQSCCGGCVRRLCQMCVRWSFEALELGE